MAENISRNLEGSFSNNTQSQVSSAVSQLRGVTSLVSKGASVVKDSMSLAREGTLLGMNISSAFTNVDQYSKLADAAGASAKSYLNSKINRIKDLWNTKVDVTVQAIMGEVSPYALGLEDIGSNLSNKLSKLIGYLLGTGSNNGDYRDLLNDIGQDALDALRSDGSLNQSISNLSAVQAYANTFNSIQEIVNIVKKVKNIYETIEPSLRIVSDMALTFWSGGTSAASASNTMVEEVEKEVSLIETLVLYAIKKLVFPLKIKVPALLVGAVDTISVKSVMLNLDEENSWLSALFDDEFWDDLDYTLSIEDSISEAISAVLSAKNSVESTFSLWKEISQQQNQSISGEDITRGDLMKELFMKEFTSSYMNKISAQARKTAYIPDYSSVSWFTKDNSTAQVNKNSFSSITPVSVSIWKSQRNDDSEENPIKNTEALKKISGILYNNL